ncbi:MAG: peptidylprolyl isomerase [Gammaproteobacteria bacterium]|nr:peptidylprolyl isomerase [Gammaproteobacteria bacterium]
MKIERDRVVRFHYVIRNESGDELESTRDDEPLAILHGRGNVMGGIEEALAGHETGDRFEVTLAPEQAFGPRRDDWTQRVSKKYFPNAARLKPGMQTTLQTDDGVRPVTVIKVGGKVIDVDLNHPRAGQTLIFDLDVIEVREATSEERAHRHVHGPGGHHH